MDYLIVTRHAGAVEWLRDRYPELREAPVMGSVTPDQVAGKIVAGNLPMALAQGCAKYYAIEFLGQPPRGNEFTKEDMIAAGVYLCQYKVEYVRPIMKDGRHIL